VLDQHGVFPFRADGQQHNERRVLGHQHDTGSGRTYRSVGWQN
jgi:hypothetical protein